MPSHSKLSFGSDLSKSAAPPWLTCTCSPLRIASSSSVSCAMCDGRSADSMFIVNQARGDPILIQSSPFAEAVRENQRRLTLRVSDSIVPTYPRVVATDHLSGWGVLMVNVKSRESPPGHGGDRGLGGPP